MILGTPGSRVQRGGSGSAGQQLVDQRRHQHARRPVPMLRERPADRRAFEIDLDGPRIARGPDRGDEARRGIDLTGGADRDEESRTARAPRRSRPCGRASRRTTRCPAAAARPAAQPGQRERRRGPRPTPPRRSQARHQARISSPCMWSSRSAAGPLVQVVDILGDDQHLARPLRARAAPAPDAPHWAAPTHRADCAGADCRSGGPAPGRGRTPRAWPHPRPDGLPTGRRRPKVARPDSAETPAPVRITIELCRTPERIGCLRPAPIDRRDADDGHGPTGKLRRDGSGGRIRTYDQRINSPLRYRCATPDQPSRSRGA